MLGSCVLVLDAIANTYHSRVPTLNKYLHVGGATQRSVRAYSGFTRVTCGVQDLPSFLQEVTTVRGQLAYASDELKAQERVPLDIDASDDVVVAELQLLVTIDTMAVEAARWVAQGHGTGASGTKCAHFAMISMMYSDSIGFTPLSMSADHRALWGCCEREVVLQAQRSERQWWACAAQPPLRARASADAACRAGPPGKTLPSATQRSSARA